MIAKGNHASACSLAGRGTKETTLSQAGRSSVSTVKNPYLSGALSLFDLLNLHPINDRSLYDDETLLKVVRQDANEQDESNKKYTFMVWDDDCELYPLTMAVALGGSLNVVQLLFDAFPKAIEHVDKNGWTVLHYACFYRASLDVAQFIVEKHPPAVEMKDEDGWTPLHIVCCKGGTVEVAGMLVERYPAAIDMKHNHGDTPLMVAKRYNPSSQVIELLQRGGVSASSSPSLPPVVAVATSSIGTSDQEVNARNCEERRRTLVNDAGNKSAADGRAKIGSVSQVSPRPAKQRQLLHKEIGKPLDDFKRLGAVQAERAKVDVVRVHPPTQRLGAKNSERSTIATTEKPVLSELEEKSLFDLLNLHPIHHRFLYNDDSLLKAIRRNPIKAKKEYLFPAYDKSNKLPPLTRAVVLNASLEVVELLHNACRDAIQEADIFGRTPIHFACRYQSSSDVVIFLADKYPSAIETKNSLGQTPLHVACTYGAPTEAVAVLVERYPTAIDISTKNGRTPLMLAEESNASPEVLELLQKVNTNSDAPRMDGNTKRPSASGNDKEQGEDTQTKSKENVTTHGMDTTCSSFCRYTKKRTEIGRARNRKKNFCLSTKKPELLFVREHASIRKQAEAHPNI